MTISVKNSAGIDTTISTIDDLLPVIVASRSTTSLASSENRIGSIGGITSYIDVTAILDTAVYAAGDVLVATQIIPNALRINDGTGVLQSISVVDQDDQKAELKIIFLSANVSMGAANAVPSISDADAVNVLGAPIIISSSDFLDLGGVAIAGKDGIAKVIKAVSGTRNLYFAIINGSTSPVFTASGIKLRFGFLLD